MDIGNNNAKAVPRQISNRNRLAGVRYLKHIRKFCDTFHHTMISCRTGSIQMLAGGLQRPYIGKGGFLEMTIILQEFMRAKIMFFSSPGGVIVSKTTTEQ